MKSITIKKNIHYGISIKTLMLHLKTFVRVQMDHQALLELQDRGGLWVFLE